MTSKKDAALSLMELATRLTRLQEEALQGLPEPLSLRQFRVLRRVNSGVTSRTVLARMAGRSLATISKSVESLTQRGLMTGGQSAVDGRNYVCDLTPAGLSALNDAIRARDELAGWLSSMLSDDDAALLAELAEAMFERAGTRLNRKDAPALPRREASQRTALQGEAS